MPQAMADAALRVLDDAPWRRRVAGLEEVRRYAGRRQERAAGGL
jgi:hypothetical protein